MAKKLVEKIIWKKSGKPLRGLDLDFLSNHFWQNYQKIKKVVSKK